MDVENKVTVKVEEILSDESSLFLVKVLVKGHVGNQKLIILLDGDEGVNIDQCSKVSRGLSEWLEEEDLIAGKYLLEVSSAGLDHPIESVRQYKKNVGRSLSVKLSDGSKLEGKLIEASDELILLEESSKKETKQHEIKLDQIEKSMVLVSFK